MALTPTVQAAIIRVAGDWALSVAQADNNRQTLFKRFAEAYSGLVNIVEPEKIVEPKKMKKK